MIDDIKQEIINNRKAIKPDWGHLRQIETDRLLEKPRPEQFKKAKPGAKIIKLQSEFPNIVQKTLAECIKNRRSLRKYKPTPLSMEELSYLLWETSRVDHYKPGITFRTIPTGGATNAMETYIYANNVTGLTQGVYHYLQDKHELASVMVAEGLTDEVNKALNRQLRGASVVFFLSAVPYRSEYKYSFASHKMIAMEAGHACQNLSLAAEIIDSGVCALAAYNQAAADGLLGLEGNEEFVTYCITVGKK